MNPQALRVFLYSEIIDRGRWPTLDAIGSHFGLDRGAARSALASMKAGKTVLVHPETGELWMAGPFADRPTPYRVRADGKSWWANCAWDMLGIVAVLGVRSQGETRCTDCGEAMSFEVDPVLGPEAEGVVHFLVPARRWYDDIGFT